MCPASILNSNQTKAIKPTTKMNQQHHVAVFAFPFSSHPSAMLSIVLKLAADSPDTFFSFFSTARSNQSLSTALTLDNGKLFTNVKLYDVSDGVHEGHVLSNSNPLEAVGFYLKVATAEAYRKSIDIAVEESGRKITCLLGEAFLSFAAELATELNVPWVCFWIASACALAAHVFADKIRDEFGVTGLAGRDNEALDMFPCLSELKASDLQEGIITGKLDSPFSQMLHKMSKSVQKATTIAINSFEGLEPVVTDHLSPMFNKFVYIGPLSQTTPQRASPDSHGCLTWLDKQGKGSVAYISFGSMITPPPHELVALAEAIEESGVPFLWSIKDHMRHHLPKGFLESGKGKIVPWAPQTQVLEHGSTGVYVTHFGWNSVMESIFGGVPMVGRPFIGENGINMRKVESVWKIGVGVRGGVFTKNGTAEALKKVMSSDEGAKMRENIRALKKVGGKAVAPNGSSVEGLKRLIELH